MSKTKSNKDSFKNSIKENIVVESREQLKEIIKQSPPDADLNHLDVSRVTDMSYMFSDKDEVEDK